MKETDQMQSLEGSGTERSVGTQTGSMTGECGGLLFRPAPRLAPCLPACPSLPPARHPTCPVSPTARHLTCSVSSSRPASLQRPPPSPPHTHCTSLTPCLPCDSQRLLSGPLSLVSLPDVRPGLCCPGFIGRALPCTGVCT